jgi:hypothetical protein
VHPRVLASLALVFIFACLPEPPAVDLVGPQVHSSSLVGPRSVEVPVRPELVVEFTEPLDPATVHPGSVALVAWELLDERCELSPICPEGSCERGRCQAQSLSSSERGAVERGEFDAGLPHAVALELELGPGEAGADSRLVIRTRRALEAHRRHSLVIGPAVRDRGGALLVDEHERAVAWQRDFVTAGVGSSGPQLRLISPAPGELDVATNLARVETAVWPPISLQPGATTALEPEDGGVAIELVEPVECPGWVPGTCLRWRPAGSLRAEVRYRAVGGSLVDRLGQPTSLPAPSRETWFRAGIGPDHAPPEAELSASLRARCLAVWVDAGEPVEALLQVGEASRRAAIDRAGWVGLELDAGVQPGDRVDWSLELRDLADNLARHEGSLEAGASFHPAIPRLRITEILANPSGPEPDAELVELLAGADGAELDGLHLSDVNFAEIEAAWLAGDPPPGDLLPARSLAPGELAIVVSSAWSPGDDDPAPPASTEILRVDASLGEGGLKNAGEPLSLWLAGEQGPVLVASYGNWVDTSAAAHGGRSLVSGPDGCDLPDRWRSHPQGRSSPGVLP